MKDKLWPNSLRRSWQHPKVFPGGPPCDARRFVPVQYKTETGSHIETIACHQPPSCRMVTMWVLSFPENSFHWISPCVPSSRPTTACVVCVHAHFGFRECKMKSITRSSRQRHPKPWHCNTETHSKCWHKSCTPPSGVHASLKRESQVSFCTFIRFKGYGTVRKRRPCGRVLA